MTRDEQYMQRCFDLAMLGAGRTSPNPVVGAVLVHQERIIGEGFHARYGGPHAEVNAIDSVPPPLRHLIPYSTLYVSLEPCCITGKTGPCTQLIVNQRIPKVVVSCLDLSPGVAGRGVEILRSAGVKVNLGILEEEGRYLARLRNHFVTRRQPYVTMKYAVTPNGYFAPAGEQQTWISGPLTQRFTHRLRSECDAILVGARTALVDDPQLNNRYYPGPSPLRIVLDRRLSLPASLRLFDGASPTWVVNEQESRTKTENHIEYVKMDFGDGFLSRLLDMLYRRRISSLMVEGGAKVIGSFFDAGLWQEAYVITGNRDFSAGLPAPHCPGVCVHRFRIGEDSVRLYRNM